MDPDLNGFGGDLVGVHERVGDFPDRLALRSRSRPGGGDTRRTTSEVTIASRDSRNGIPARSASNTSGAPASGWWAGSTATSGSRHTGRAVRPGCPATSRAPATAALARSSASSTARASGRNRSPIVVSLTCLGERSTSSTPSSRFPCGGASAWPCSRSVRSSSSRPRCCRSACCPRSVKTWASRGHGSDC